MPRSRFGLIKAIIWQRTLFGKLPISKEPFWQAIIIWQKYLWQAVFLLCQNSMWYKAVESFGSSIVSRNLNQSNVMLTIVWSLNLKHHSTQRIYKEYFPNLLETWLLPRFFVFRVRDLKFWLLTYFLISFNCAKFQKVWTTLM